MELFLPRNCCWYLPKKTAKSSLIEHTWNKTFINGMMCFLLVVCECQSWIGSSNLWLLLYLTVAFFLLRCLWKRHEAVLELQWFCEQRNLCFPFNRWHQVLIYYWVMTPFDTRLPFLSCGGPRKGPRQRNALKKLEIWAFVLSRCTGCSDSWWSLRAVSAFWTVQNPKQSIAQVASNPCLNWPQQFVARTTNSLKEPSLLPPLPVFVLLFTFGAFLSKLLVVRLFGDHVSMCRKVPRLADISS